MRASLIETPWDWVLHHSDFLGLCVGLATMIGAFWAASTAWNVLGIERKRDQKLSGDLEKHQAVQVSSWLGTTIVESKTQIGPLASTWSTKYELVVANLSTQPIFAVKVDVFLDDSQVATYEFRCLPPKTEECKNLDKNELLTVLPSRNTEDSIYTSRHAAQNDSIDLAGLGACRMTFSDAQGIRWTRTEIGLLEKTKK
jgi:hypothetical protein